LFPQQARRKVEGWEISAGSARYIHDENEKSSLQQGRDKLSERNV